MEKKGRFELVKKVLTGGTLAFLMLFLVLGEIEEIYAASKHETATEGHMNTEEVREQLTGAEHNYNGMKGLAHRMISAEGVKSFLAPVLLILLVILISFVAVEVMIKKNKEKE